MKLEEKHRKYIVVVILAIFLLQLLGSGLLGLLVDVLQTPEATTLLLFLGTGYVIRQSAPAPTEAATEPTPTQPPEISAEPPVTGGQAAFAPEDADLVQVNSACGYKADVKDYLAQSLSWNLKQDGPTVLIIHSHGTESYTQIENYQESSPYRTKDVGFNVVSIGDRLVQVLEMGGVHAVHDRTMHDDPSYNASYSNARESIAYYLQQYPSIRLVLDIHRDSVENSQGDQVLMTTQINGVSAAQLMLVVGTDAGGLTHPNWPENMSLAVKLHAQLEKNSPGICRPISFRSQRFNQDLSPGALIVEVGSAGNTRQEALLAVEQLGRAIIDLANGTTTTDSTR